MSTSSDHSEYYEREAIRIAHLAAHGIPARPGRRFVADFVAMQRSLRQWKKQTLASVADVSLSTIERVERGESVSDNSLDKIAVALGFENDAFTSFRVPLNNAEAAVKAEEAFDIFRQKLWVEVEPIRKHHQIVDFADCLVNLICTERLDTDVSMMADELRDWLELAHSVRSQEFPRSERERRRIKRRDLYNGVLGRIRGIERASDAVALGGVYEPETDIPDFSVKVALIAFMPKKDDPALMKRRQLLAPQRIELIPGIMSAPQTV